MPAEIGGLAALKVLWVNNNPDLTALPAEIGRLTHLTILKIKGYHPDLSASRETFERIKDLVPAGCEVSADICKTHPTAAELRAKVGRNPWLDLSNSGLAELPADLDKLAAEVTGLYIHGNPDLRGVLPPALWRLTRLELLDLRNCGLGSVPAEIGGLAALRKLWVGNNPDLAALPATVGRLPKLTNLDIRGCHPDLCPSRAALQLFKDMLPAGCRVWADISSATHPTAAELKAKVDWNGVLNLRNSGLAELPADLDKLDGKVTWLDIGNNRESGTGTPSAGPRCGGPSSMGTSTLPRCCGRRVHNGHTVDCVPYQMVAVMCAHEISISTSATTSASVSIRNLSMHGVMLWYYFIDRKLGAGKGRF
eukprot:SAG22_NODE_2334_length_2704_cov_1.163532_2_plen_366_part_00